MEKIFLNQLNSLNNIFIRLLSEEATEKNFKFKFYKLFNYFIDFAMIIAPSLTYVFQIIKFNKTKSSQGFSKFICLLIFLGNLLRVFFWFGKKFKKTLLYQSILTIILQIILVHYFMKYQNKKLYLQDIKVPSTNKQLKIEKKNNINLIKNYIAAYFSKTFKPKMFNLSKIFSIKIFWNWQEEIEYYKFMVLIFIILSILFSIFRNYNLFLQIIGSLSASFEALTCFPQVVENCRTKVTKNISFWMVVCWFFGDSFRFGYNLYYKSPVQLTVGMGIMVLFDSILVMQLIMYRNNDFKEIEKHQNKKQIEEINQLMKSIDELNVAK
jgi:uncharacterized protein with PQ loop repeat